MFHEGNLRYIIRKCIYFSDVHMVPFCAIYILKLHPLNDYRYCSHIKTFVKVARNSTDYFMWNGNNFLTNDIVQLLNRWKAMSIPFILSIPIQENHTGASHVIGQANQYHRAMRSDDRKSAPSNVSSNVKWAIGPYCLNQTLFLSSRIFIIGL